MHRHTIAQTVRIDIYTYMYPQHTKTKNNTWAHVNSLTKHLPLGQQMAHARQKDRKGGLVPSCSPSMSSQ